MKPLVDIEIIHPELTRPMIAVEKPIPDPVFRPQQHRHQRDDHIMERHPDGCRNPAAPEAPRRQNPQKRFEAKKRREPEEYPNGRPARNAMGRIVQLDQPMPMQPQESEKSFHCRWQIRSKNGVSIEPRKV